MAGPNDLNVNLTIDASIFQQGLNDAVKQLNDFSAKVKAAGDSVNTTMTNMKKSTDPLKDAFGELGDAILKIGVVSFIESVVEGGAAIARLAESTSMTTESLLEISRAAASVGKDTGNLATALGFLEKAAQNANDGNLKLRADFQALGISMEDLKTHSPDEVFNMVVKALGNMEDPAKRAQIAYELLSRQFKGVDFKALSAQIEENRGKMADAAAGAEAAQRAYASLAVFIGDVKNQILALLAPILQFISYITDLADKFGVAKLAGDALLGVFLGITSLGIAKVFLGIAGAIGSMVAAMAPLLVEFAPIVGLFAAGVAAGTALAVVFDYLTSDSKSLSESLGKVETQIGENLSYVYQKFTGLINTNTDALKKNKDEQKIPLVTGPTLDPNAGAVQNLKNQLEMMKLTNEETQKRIALEISLVGASDTRKAAELANFDNERKHLIEIQKLNGDIAKLEAEQANKRGADHSQEISVLNQMKSLENQRYESFKEQNSELQKAKDIEKERLSYRQLEQQVSNNIKELDRQVTEATLTDTQKKIAEIQKWADAQISAYAKIRQAELGSNADVTQDKLYQDRVKAVQNFAQQEADATQKSIDAARSWSNEWQKSINQYVENASNGATEAKKLFDDSTKGMEDAIVNFAKTGKLSFDQLLQNIAEDILRSQIRQLFANLFTGAGVTSSGGGSSSLFSGVGKLLGFADGGTIPTNAPVIVGEQGPEIISGAAGMQVTPNSQIGQSNSQSSMTNVTYNINATDARSFQQMIAQDPSFIYAVTLRGQNMIPGAGGL